MIWKHNRVAILTNEQESPPARNSFHRYTLYVRRLSMVCSRTVVVVVATAGGDKIWSGYFSAYIPINVSISAWLIWKCNRVVVLQV
jgi:hypothetical protein